MSSNCETRRIAVMGATGSQGKGVIKALLEFDGAVKYQVRPMCRFVNSKASRRFAVQFPNLALVSWQEDSLEDLEDCFHDCFGVFIQTDTYAFPLKTRKVWTRSEIDLGQRIIIAARKCNIQHVVYSSLPSIFNATDGNQNIRHFETKNHIAKLIKASSLPYTIMTTGPFMTNVFTPQYSYHLGDTFILSTPANPEKMCGWVDPIQDIGNVVRASFEKGLVGEEISVCGKQISYAELARTCACVTGFKAIYVQCSVEDFKTRVCKETAFQEDLEALGEWLANMPGDKSLYGTVVGEEVMKSERLTGVRFSSWDDYLRSARWLIPAKQTEFKKSVTKPLSIKVNLRI